MGTDIELGRMKEYVAISRKVLLTAMDARSMHVSLLANIYHEALHAYRVELRRVRSKEDSK